MQRSECIPPRSLKPLTTHLTGKKERSYRKLHKREREESDNQDHGLYSFKQQRVKVNNDKKKREARRQGSVCQQQNAHVQTAGNFQKKIARNEVQQKKTGQPRIKPQGPIDHIGWCIYIYLM